MRRTKTPPHVVAIERPVPTRSDRHLFGDHRRCGSLCPRARHDDRLPACIHDSLMNGGWFARINPSPEQAEEYLASVEGRTIVRNGLLAAIPWLRV